MNTKLSYRIAQWGIYPMTMIIAVLLFFALRNSDDKLFLSTTIPFLFTIAVIIISEKHIPFDISWKPKLKDLKTDGLYFFFIQTIFPNILVWFTTLFIIGYINKHDLVILHIWPHDLPIGIQEIMVVLISDLLRYWLHRLNHTIPFLWRLHAVHHSVDKLYWMNTTRFHPIEKAMQFMMDVLPFMMLGVSKEVIGLHLVLYGVNGFFQHSNIDLRYGWLNYIVSSTELHRWHHSRKPEESNKNYGNNVIVWDLLFGSFFMPEGKKVNELGLINKNYPGGFYDQMKAPLINKYDKTDLPETDILNLFLNLLLKLKISLAKITIYKKFINGTKDCDKVQHNVLMKIVNGNKESGFGKKYQFDKINSYADFKKHVPIHDFEMLRPYINEQAKNKNNALIRDNILMFNRTSGTSSEPKLLPVTKETLKGLKTSQQISTYIQYQEQPLGFFGKITGIVSPAIDDISENNIPIGSASGHFYKNIPFFVRSKYVVPHSVFEITDYEVKYYCILLLSLQHRDITYFGTANPTTFLKLIEILNEKRTELLNDLRSETVSGVPENLKDKVTPVLKKLKPSKKRIAEIEKIFASESKLTFKNIWPHIKLLNSWTGGSCGIPLSSVLALMPENITVIDPGYLSSELRGTVTYNIERQSGLTTFEDNFFEFVERGKWENEQQDFILLHELELNKEYYVFVTTPAGLYRYDMNDIIRVDGFVNKCPLVKFIQKGKGVCNITGEKLYESQLLNALGELSLNFAFVQVLANEEACTYECYLELATDEIINKNLIAEKLDALLCKQNTEYKEKRASNRLKCIQIKILKKGTFEVIKKKILLNKKSEGQYKTTLLLYKRNATDDLEQFVSEHD